MNILLRKSLIFFFVGLVAASGTARSDTPSILKGTTEKKIWEAVNDTYQLTLTSIEKEEPIYSASKTLGQSCNVNLATTNNAADLLQEARFWEENYGLELRGGITTGDLESSDVDDGGTTYLELSWDVLDNGYKEFEYRSEDLKRRAALERIASQLEQVANQYRCRGFQIGLSFVGIEAKIATAKLALMESVYKIEQEAYFNGASDLDELLVSEEALFTLRRRLEQLNSPLNYQQAAFEIHNLPAFDINIVELLNSMANDTRFRNASNLEQQRVSAINPYQDGNRLRFFVRKELSVLSSNRDDLVAGLRFSVPLAFANRPSYQRKLQQIEQERTIDEWERVTRVREAYQSFVEQSERVITQNYRYLRSKERMRRVFSRKALGDPLVQQAVVARLVTYLDASLELISAKQALYERANTVFLTSRLDFSPQYIRALPMSIDNYRSRPFTRAVYVWSDAFNQLSNEQLLLVMKTQSYSRVILSYSQRSDKDKLSEFVASANDQGIKVELMLSDNEWVYERNHQKAANAIAAISLQSGNIHLDIEPQVFDTYDNQKALYQQRYIDMLKAIRQQSPDVYLSVSVPFHWKLDTYREVAAIANKLVVMNYENDRADTLVRRMKFILQVVPKSKIAMAIRPKDFVSNFALEETLKLVNEASGVDEFVIHKLADLLDGSIHLKAKE